MTVLSPALFSTSPAGDLEAANLFTQLLLEHEQSGQILGLRTRAPALLNSQSRRAWRSHLPPGFPLQLLQLLLHPLLPHAQPLLELPWHHQPLHLLQQVRERYVHLPKILTGLAPLGHQGRPGPACSGRPGNLEFRPLLQPLLKAFAAMLPQPELPEGQELLILTDVFCLH